jgi:tetratricopeptide (TPR) repeat protein
MLQDAEAAEHDGRLDEAESYFKQAVDSSQEEYGYFDVNVAKCLLAYAQFLEARNRYADACLRYKLAAGIYKKGGHMAAHGLAAGSVTRMEVLAMQAGDKPTV